MSDDKAKALESLELEAKALDTLEKDFEQVRVTPLAAARDVPKE